MAAYFLDTSALVKRYHPETGTPSVDQLFSDPGAELIISRIGLVEIISAFALKVRAGTIALSSFEQYRLHVHRDVRKKAIRVARIMVRDFQLADELLSRHGTELRLRTLDALPLAAAIHVQSRALATFVCADDVLCQIAKTEGLAVANPAVGFAP